MWLGSAAMIFSRCSAPSAHRPARTRMLASRKRPLVFAGSRATTRSASGSARAPRRCAPRGSRRASAEPARSPAPGRSPGRAPARARSFSPRALWTLARKTRAATFCGSARRTAWRGTSASSYFWSWMRIRPRATSGAGLVGMGLGRGLEHALRLVEVGHLAVALGQAEAGPARGPAPAPAPCGTRRSRRASRGPCDGPPRAPSTARGREARAATRLAVARDRLAGPPFGQERPGLGGRGLRRGGSARDDAGGALHTWARATSVTQPARSSTAAHRKIIRGVHYADARQDPRIGAGRCSFRRRSRPRRT